MDYEKMTEEYSKQIHYLRKEIGAWARELTKILEGHFEIASSDNLQTVKLIRKMEAMAE